MLSNALNNAKSTVNSWLSNLGNQAKAATSGWNIGGTAVVGTSRTTDSAKNGNERNKVLSQQTKKEVEKDNFVFYPGNVGDELEVDETSV